MKKSKTKATKKALVKKIKAKLIKVLKESTSGFVKNSKKLDKLINKESKKLVKQLSKKLKIKKSDPRPTHRPSVPKPNSGSGNDVKSIILKRKKAAQETKVSTPVPSSASSRKNSSVQGVKKPTASPKVTVTE